MTKFIFHGGDTRFIGDDNNGFFAEITRGSIGKTKILLNYFSRNNDELDECFKEDKSSILRNSQNKEVELEFEIALEQSWAEQIKTADIMYVRGGNTAKLVKKMKTNNLETILSGKTIAGSSAGVYVFSKYYWENDNDTLGSGLGLLNVKAFCHYSSDDINKIYKLLNYKENLPLITLPNHKWIVIYI